MLIVPIQNAAPELRAARFANFFALKTRFERIDMYVEHTYISRFFMPTPMAVFGIRVRARVDPRTCAKQVRRATPPTRIRDYKKQNPRLISLGAAAQARAHSILR